MGVAMKKLSVLRGLLAAATVLLVTPTVSALEARSTADIHSPGSFSLGVFRPLTVSFFEGAEFELHPLVALISPHVTLRVPHVSLPTSSFRLAGEYGLSLPSLAWKGPVGVAGYLTPSCKVTDHDASQAEWCDEPGWILVPRAGIAASLGGEHVWTFRVDGAVGVLLAGQRGYPLDAPPALDLLMAPAFQTYRVHGGVRYDRSLLPWLRASVELDVYWVGDTPAPQRSPLTIAAHLGADIAVGETSRATIGIKYWNSDQRAVAIVEDSDGFAQIESVRSNDFLPTLDFIWSFP
jgi:hypothetical protein